MLVPSSNTILEPVTVGLLPPDGSVTAHVSRLRVLRIADDDSTQSQFDSEPMLQAADLLADAKVDLILWNGTAAAWLGFARDEAITTTIAARTGIQATTAVIALNQRLQDLGARRIGLVTPYVADIERQIIANYRAIGIEIVAAARADRTDNASFADIAPDEVAAMVRRVAVAPLDAILILCTNMAGAPVATALTAELGIPVLDSVVVAVEHSLARLAA
jgi:maleate isomerase